MSANLILEKNVKISTSIKDLDKLSKYFDIVEIDRSHKKYNLLTCKDRVVKANNTIQYSVWLQLKVSKGSSAGTAHYQMEKTCDDKLEDTVSKILPWVDLLINFEENSNSSVQLSLFDEPQKKNGIILEKEPESPGTGNDRAWGPYFKKCEQVKINNLKKQYKFFELFEDTRYHIYRDNDWRKFLPSNDELIEEAKRIILKYKDNVGRYDDGWFDDEYKYLTRDGALSDYELFYRLRLVIRLYFVPYKRYFHISTDDSYSSWESKEENSHRFWFSGREMNYSCSSDYDKNDLPKYDLFQPDFIQWIRDTLNIANKDYITDDEALKSGIEQFMRGNKLMDNWKEIIQECRTDKEFLSRINTYLTDDDYDSRNGGQSLCGVDGYNGRISYDKKKSKIELDQDLMIREMLDRDITNVTRFGDVNVYILTGKEIYLKAFSLFKKQQSKQKNIFDIIG